MQDNKISLIEKDTFKGLINSNEVNLESNKIVSFNKNALIDLKKLKKVCLLDNPILISFPNQLTIITRYNPLIIELQLSIRCK